MPTRVVYSDLDGTMVGPGGSFFHTEDRQLTLAPAQALVALHDAGIALVLVSGRTRPQLVEASRIFGADGFIGELGAVIGWDRGRRSEVLAGDMPSTYDGSPVEVMERLGIVQRLLEQYAGRLEYHAPWHLDHQVDVMLRGRVDVAEAESSLASVGLGWLRLRDNGVLAPGRPTSLDLRLGPAHVYHLMPAGLSKELALARDLSRRGLRRADAVAIGDSASDLEMAAYVDSLWLTANGARQDHMQRLARGLGNVRPCSAAVGLGWAEAVASVLRDR